jgi:glycerate-2-kinase
MIIKNFDDLALNEGRKIALQILEAGLEAINTKNILEKSITLRDEKILINNQQVADIPNGKIILVGIGKCAIDGISVLNNLLGDHVSSGVVVDIRTAVISDKIKVFKGTHPMPSEDNLVASRSIVNELTGLTENDLVIFLVSGGGSTLLCLPEDRGCKEESDILENLFKAGADIIKINTVRKHLSLARGGFLAKYAYPANVVSLIFSDVSTNELSFISSGPTVKDETTIEDASKVLVDYDILKKCGIENCGLIETPKEDQYFTKVKNILLVSNDLALQKMNEKALELGYESETCSNCLVGEAKEVGKNIATVLHRTSPGKILIYGGETTVVAMGKGEGGRNQELVLGALGEIQAGEIILASSSDGRDNTDHAGALCDIITKDKTESLGVNPVEYLQKNDSYNFFKKIGDYILTGDTGSNISDLVVAIKLQISA